MGADQIAEVAPVVSEVIEAAAGGLELCATFEVTGEKDKWVQLTAGSLNVAYPSDEPPGMLLARLGVRGAESLELVEWEARVFATFNIEGSLTVREIAKLIDAIFESTLGCAGREYSVDVDIIELSSD